MKIKDYMNYVSGLRPANKRIYGSGIYLDMGNGRGWEAVGNLCHRFSGAGATPGKNLQDIIVAAGSGGYVAMRRTNKRACWIRKLLLRKLDLAK